MSDLDELLPYVMNKPTPASEAEAEEVYRHALAAKHPLPVGYVVRAKVSCNQLDTFRLVACDWVEWIEGRHEDIEAKSHLLLRAHLRQAHPYLDASQRRQLVGATVMNVRDFGR